jgi:amino acid permease
MSSSNLKTLVALINAMIGSAMLVLPLMSLEAGILTTIVLVLVCGMYSLYSCKLVF